MAPGRAESDFGLQGWIDTLELKQILLIFSLWRAAREKLNEVQLLRLGAPSHTSAPFYLRTWNLRAYARKNYAKVEIHLMVICGRLFCRTFKPSPRSAFQQDRRISRTFCVVNTTRELGKKRRGRWKQRSQTTTLTTVWTNRTLLAGPFTIIVRLSLSNLIARIAMQSWLFSSMAIVLTSISSATERLKR